MHQLVRNIQIESGKAGGDVRLRNGAVSTVLEAIAVSFLSKICSTQYFQAYGEGPEVDRPRVRERLKRRKKKKVTKMRSQKSYCTFCYCFNAVAMIDEGKACLERQKITASNICHFQSIYCTWPYHYAQIRDNQYIYRRF